MKIADKIKKLVHLEDESNTMVIRGIKYKSVKNGWAPILNEPTVCLIDSRKAES